MKKKLLLCIVMFILIFLSSGQNEADASKGHMDEIIKQIENEIEGNMKTHDIPGMSFVLVDREGILYVKGFGVLDVSDDTKLVDEYTNFKIGSISKVFTSLAIMQLQEEGLLHVDDPVVEHLPWFATKDTLMSDQITIKHLLNHSSGLPDRLNVHEMTSLDKEIIEREISHKLRNVTLVANPGESIEYTNMHTDLLQVIIEKVTGESFPQYMENRIFQPLEMNRTGFFDFLPEELPNTAMGHRYHWGNIKPYEDHFVYASSGSAGLSSNAVDLGKYMTFLLLEGHTPAGVIHANSLSEMHQVSIHFPWSQSGKAGYGYAWEVTPHVIVHGGGRPGYTAHIMLLQDQSYGFALLSNSKQDITNATSNNIYTILQGGTPHSLLKENHPKISSDAQLILLITITVGIFLLYLIGSIVYGCVKGSLTISFSKPSMNKIVLLIVKLALFVCVMSYIYVYLPFIIGVPSLYEFKMEPDVTSGLAMFTIVYSVLTLAIFVRLLLMKKVKILKIANKQHMN